MSKMSVESIPTNALWEISRYVLVTMGLLMGSSWFCTPLAFSNQEYKGKAQGTPCIVTIPQFPDDADWTKLTDEIQNRLDVLEQMIASHRADSEVCRFNAFVSTEDWFPVSEKTAYIVQTAWEIAQLTQGQFDIVLPLPELSKVYSLPHSGYKNLSVRFDPPALKKADSKLAIDLSAVATGVAVDCIAELLEEQKITDYMVEVGNCVRCKGKKNKDTDWNIGIEKPPLRTSKEFPGLQQKLVLREQSLVTYCSSLALSSALVYRSVSVIAPDCFQADAWAEAMFLLGGQGAVELANQHGIAVLVLHRRNDEDVGEISSKHWVLKTQVEVNLSP